MIKTMLFHDLLLSRIDNKYYTALIYYPLSNNSQPFTSYFCLLILIKKAPQSRRGTAGQRVSMGSTLGGNMKNHALLFIYY